MIDIEQITLDQKVRFIGNSDFDPCIGSVKKIYPPRKGEKIHSVLLRQEDWLPQKSLFLVREFRALLSELEFSAGEFFCCICGITHKTTERCKKLP